MTKQMASARPERAGVASLCGLRGRKGRRDGPRRNGLRGLDDNIRAYSAAANSLWDREPCRNEFHPRRPQNAERRTQTSDCSSSLPFLLASCSSPARLHPRPRVCTRFSLPRLRPALPAAELPSLRCRHARIRVRPRNPVANQTPRLSGRISLAYRLCHATYVHTRGTCPPSGRLVARTRGFFEAAAQARQSMDSGNGTVEQRIRTRLLAETHLHAPRPLTAPPGSQPFVQYQ